MSDAFTDRRRFRALSVVDDYGRECLALVADTSLSGHPKKQSFQPFRLPKGRFDMRFDPLPID